MATPHRLTRTRDPGVTAGSPNGIEPRVSTLRGFPRPTCLRALLGIFGLTCALADERRVVALPQLRALVFLKVGMQCVDQARNLRTHHRQDVRAAR